MARPAINARLIFPMTVNAIRHICQLERRYHFAHRLNFAVTFLTWNILNDVWLMIEINKVWHNIYFRPSNGNFLIPRRPYFLHLGLCCSNKLMASYASLYRRDHCRFSPPRSAVAILAAHLVLSGMNFMTEGNRLTRFELLLLTSAREHKNGCHQRVTKCCKNNQFRPQTHYCFFLRFSNSAALHTILPAYVLRMLSTSAGATASALLPNADRAKEMAAAISSFESLSLN